MLRGETAWCMQLYRDPFLGALVKLRKPTTTYVMSVRLSSRMEQLGWRRTDFREILYCGALWKSIEKIQALLNS